MTANRHLAGSRDRRDNPIVEQYAAINVRRREIKEAERIASAAPHQSSAAPSGYAIRVHHGGRASFLSWVSEAGNPMLNPCPGAAMRLARLETAAALIDSVPALRDKAGCGEAAIVDLAR